MDKRIDTAVILAAGKGTRLIPYTYDIPKGFMTVGGETLIERSIRLLRKNGIDKIIIGTGHLSEHYAELARKLDLVTYLNPDFASTGSFHTLQCGSELIEGDYLLLESDLLYEELAIKSLIDDDSPNTILCSGFTQSEDEVFVETNETGNLKALSKMREELKSIDAELVGIWKVSSVLHRELMKHYSTAPDASTKDYEHAIASIAKSHPVKVLKINELVWCEIDNEQHLQRAKSKILPRLN